MQVVIEICSLMQNKHNLLTIVVRVGAVGLPVCVASLLLMVSGPTTLPGALTTILEPAAVLTSVPGIEATPCKFATCLLLKVAA